ncbi:MAG: ANTAR domain-containing protein [Pseudomonadota bacterium]
MHAQNAGMVANPPFVLVIDTNDARAAIIKDGLRAEGYTRIEVITQMDQLAARIVTLQPDVIVVDLGNPNRDMLENMLQVTRAVKRPVAMFVDRSDKPSMEKAIEAGVSAYVVDGFRQDRIKSIMEMAISRFNAFSRLERELETAKSALADRTTIDKAKGLIMKSRGLSEEKAYALLRKSAMDQNRRIVEVAESLLLSASLLGDGDE